MFIGRVEFKPHRPSDPAFDKEPSLQALTAARIEV